MNSKAIFVKETGCAIPKGDAYEEWYQHYIKWLQQKFEQYYNLDTSIINSLELLKQIDEAIITDGKHFTIIANGNFHYNIKQVLKAANIISNDTQIKN